VKELDRDAVVRDAIVLEDEDQRREMFGELAEVFGGRAQRVPRCHREQEGTPLAETEVHERAAREPGQCPGAERVPHESHPRGVEAIGMAAQGLHEARFEHVVALREIVPVDHVRGKHDGVAAAHHVLDEGPIVDRIVHAVGVCEDHDRKRSGCSPRQEDGDPLAGPARCVEARPLGLVGSRRSEAAHDRRNRRPAIGGWLRRCGLGSPGFRLVRSGVVAPGEDQRAASEPERPPHAQLRGFMDVPARDSRLPHHGQNRR
jgi:hypothetical protein